jgi:hypothetical protein
MLGESSFLLEPQWVEYLDSFEPDNEANGLLMEVAGQLTHWPDLITRIRALHSGLLSSTDLEALKNLISKIQSRLAAIDIFVEEHLATEEYATIVPSVRADSPFNTVYAFRKLVGLELSNLLCAYILILSNMASHLKDFENVSACKMQPLDMRGRLTEYHKGLVVKVCRSFEFTTFRKPLLSDSCVLSLTVAYCYAESEDLRNWILKSLNEADEHRLLTTPRYTPETVEFLNNLFIGAVSLPQSQGKLQLGDATQNYNSSSRSS